MFNGDIYFKCPCCRKALVVERAAAGFEAPCPGCQASILIPRRSGIPPRLQRRAGLVALNAGILGVMALVLANLPSAGHPEARRTPANAASARAAHQAESTRTKQPSSAPDAKELASGLDELRTKNELLAQKNNELATQFEGMASWVLENYQGKYPLPLDLLTKLHIPPLKDDFTLHGELAQFLKVTPKEETMANDAFLYTRDQMQKAETALVSVTQAADNSVTLYVPPYEKEGAALREDLYGALEAALGAPRFDKLVDVTQKELTEAFHYFGTAGRTMQFEVVPQQGTDAAYLLIRDAWQIPDGESMTRYSGRETAVREIPTEYTAYLNWLPAGVAAFPVQQKNGG